MSKRFVDWIKIEGVIFFIFSHLATFYKYLYGMYNYYIWKITLDNDYLLAHPPR